MIYSFGSPAPEDKSEKSSSNSSTAASPSETPRASNASPSHKPIVIEINSANKIPPSPKKEAPLNKPEQPRKNSSGGQRNSLVGIYGAPVQVFPTKSEKPATSSRESSQSKEDEEKEENFEPSSFMDQISRDYPEWKRQLMARQMAEKAKKDHEEKKKKEAYENRYAHLPPWKRQMMEKKDAEAKVAEEKAKQLAEEEERKSRRTSYPFGNSSAVKKAPLWPKS